MIEFIRRHCLKALLLIVLTHGSVNVADARAIFRIDEQGNVAAVPPGELWYGVLTIPNPSSQFAGFWINPLTNQIFAPVASGSWQDLKTNLFTVSQISDVTYIGSTTDEEGRVRTSAWVRLSNGEGYRIDEQGNVAALPAGELLYGVLTIPNPSSQFAGFRLNTLTNQILAPAASGGWRDLKTNLFTVSQISDVTYVGSTSDEQGRVRTSAWVRLSNGEGYRIDEEGNVAALPPGEFLYGVLTIPNPSSDFAGFQINALTNQIFAPVASSGWQDLKTTLFTTSQILDVTYIGSTTDEQGLVRTTAFVTVDRHGVPEPETLALLLATLPVLRSFVRRRACR